MAGRRFIFRCGSKELILPVTPSKYERTQATQIETVNIHTFGEVNLTGERKLDTVTVSCLLPANNYPFSESSEPEPYVTQLKKWCAGKNVLRFIIGNTDINMPCLIESVSFGERDGTNDIYADIVLREYARLSAVRVQDTGTSNAPRAPVEAERTLDEAVQAQNYTAYQPRELDTIASVCALKYGPFEYTPDTPKSGFEDIAEARGFVVKKREASTIEKVVATINNVNNIFEAVTGIEIKLPNLKG